MTTTGGVSELVELLSTSSWFCRVLEIVAEVDPPEWWVGAGVIRDIVWDTRFGDGFDPGAVKDVDVLFFDPSDLCRERDDQVERALIACEPDIPWEAKNQAAVHLWYPARFGISVAPFSSAAEAVATFPETATAVAARLDRTGTMEVLAPHGLDDLLDGVWRRNPTRVTVAEYERRLANKKPTARWRAVRVVSAA
jgi:hypothetical protein